VLKPSTTNWAPTRQLLAAEIWPRSQTANPLFTIGHSTRTAEELIALLREVGVTLLVDIRTVPRSRFNPQFNTDVLPETLAAAGIGYRHFPALGGLRHRPKGAPPSPNGLWQSEAFQAYADYAMTAPFRDALDELRGHSQDHVCAIMCAEAVWWRCHRRIVADYLLAAGDAVEHIMGEGKIEPATLTPGAEPQPDGTILYPAAQGLLI
jgi:uncharacterized protein (DUF488 family)